MTNSRSKPERTQIMTLEETADYLQIHKTTLWRLIKAKSIPAFKVGNRWRIKKALLDSFLENKIEKTASL